MSDFSKISEREKIIILFTNLKKANEKINVLQEQINEINDRIDNIFIELNYKENEDTEYELYDSNKLLNNYRSSLLNNK